MKKLTVAVIGAGNRGQTYTNIMKEMEQYEVVAVAEPRKERREYIQNTHKLPDEMCFTCWEDFVKQPKMADIAIVSTQDRMHFAPAMKLIELGYNLLLEKPAAPTAEECQQLADAAKKRGVKILVCHVLRYSPFFRKLKDLIDADEVGKVLSIHHDEDVGNRHQSHSFVRGNWGNEADSACMILAKSCHDMDMLQWLIGSPCKQVQSFGSLSYFTPENCPEGAPDYCIEGCPHGETCYYNAVKLYLDDVENLWFRETATMLIKPTQEEMAHTLRTTQYGKCVFKCNNDVVDHQVVNLEFENGAIASFNMSAFNKGGRHIRIMGTKGEIFGDMSRGTIELYRFSTREYEMIDPSETKLTDSILDGHGGGDGGIVRVLHKYLTEDYDGDLLSEIGISVQNHMIAFAAETSRKENRVVKMSEFGY